MKVIWKPQPKQLEFLQRPEYEAVYGGAAGGGKSDALLAEALRQVGISHYRAIIFRKTFPECTELVDRSREIYSLAYPEAKYNSQKYMWSFPSGAKIYFGSMQHTADRLKYQGRRYDFIGFDELTHFTFDEYSYMFSRNRPGGPGTRCYIRATCNPGGIGHSWVMERFISGREPYKTYYETMKVNGREYKRSRIFIPSTVFDNQILLDNNPGYIASLGMLPQAEMKALLYGDWNSFAGQVFAEFRNNPDGYFSRKHTHVIEPFDIPDSWRRYRSFDFGYSRPFSVGWWAVDNDGRVYRYRELYGSNGEPNIGLKWHPKQVAQKIREIEDKHERGHKITGIADPSIWDSSRGSEGSIINMFESCGVYFERGDNDRIGGKMQLHYRLAFDEDGYPGFYVFKTCADFIRTVPALLYDKFDIEDVDSKLEDHIYDEVRYFLMTNPIAPQKKEKKEEAVYNPLMSDY